MADAEYATRTTATGLAGTGRPGGSVGDTVYATAYPTPVPGGPNVYDARATGTNPVPAAAVPAFNGDGQVVYSDADDTSAPSYMPMTSPAGAQDTYEDPYDPELQGYGVYAVPGVDAVLYSVPTGGGDSVVVDNTTA